MTTQLTFQSTTLQTINRNNQTYITASDLARALQYADVSAVNRIYSRHEDEFSPDMTSSVNLTDLKNTQYEQRLFSLRGAHLIAMFARTPVAKAFRKWVLDILDKEVLQNLQPTLPLAQVEADEEALHIIVNLFHSLNGAYEMGKRLRTQAPNIAKQIDNELGGYYIYNLNMPTANALHKAKTYIHAKSERIMFVKGMSSLLETPNPKRIANF